MLGTWFDRFIADESAQGLPEYAVALAVILLAVATLAQTLGSEILRVFTAAAQSVQASA